MNCRSAQRLLSAKRDGPLANRERADLDTHLADCGDCRAARLAVSNAIDAWRSASAKATVPDAERAWQDIRREIRGAAAVKRDGAWALPRWSLPVAAAASLIFAVTLVPRWLEESARTTPHLAAIARADFVETAKNTSSVVYVDDQSGWLVVWAVSSNDKL